MEKEYSIEYPFSFCVTAGHRSPQRLETTQIASGHSLKKSGSRDFQMNRQIFFEKKLLFYLADKNKCPIFVLQLKTKRYDNKD